MSDSMDFGKNWEAIVKMFLQRIDVPTKEDLHEIHHRLDKLEQLIYQKQPVARKESQPRISRRKSASAIVMEIISNHPDGTNFKTIKAATGFNDKKLRNIIFRLDKIGRIKRVSRGIYKTI